MHPPQGNCCGLQPFWLPFFLDRRQGFAESRAMPTDASLFGMRHLPHPTPVIAYSTIRALLISGLLFLGACHRNSLRIAGLWELDREMAYQAAEQKLRQELGSNAPAEFPRARKQIDADLVFYEFAANGSVSIRYNMTSLSYGFERGTWKQEGEFIIVKTRKEQGSRAGIDLTRVYEVVGDRLRWVDGNGMVWHLKRKTP